MSTNEVGRARARERGAAVTEVFAGVWAQNLLASVRLAALLWLAWGLGVAILRLLRIAAPGALDDAVLAAGLGCGALGAATLALGAAGLYGPTGFAAFYAALAALALAAFRSRRAAFAAALRAWRFERRDPGVWVLTAAALAAWAFALSPTVFYDTLVYHFAVPNLYLLRGAVVPLPNLVYSNFPLQAEMIYLLGLQMGGERLAGLVSSGFAILAAAALAALVRRLAHPAAGRTAAALFLLAPPVLLSVRFGTVETLLALFFTLEVWCLHRWRDGAGRGWAVAAGLFAGWCFSTKYAGGLFALLPPLVYLAEDAARTGRLAVRDALALAGSAIVAALPWLVKNAVFTGGNPVFPAFYGFLGGNDWSAARGAVVLADSHASWLVATSPIDFARLPLDLVLHPERFGAAAASAWIWPVTLAAVVAALAAPRDRAAIRLSAILAGYLLIWGASFWLARLLIPAMAIGFALAAIALHRSLPGRTVVRGALLAALALWTAAVLMLDAPTRNSLAPALGLQEADAYLAGMISSHPAVRFINDRLPPEARVLVIGEARVARLRRDHLHGSPYDPAPLGDLVGADRTVDGLASGLSRAGFTHLLVNNRELARVERDYPLAAMDPALKAALSSFLNERCRLLAKGANVHLFALPAR